MCGSKHRPSRLSRVPDAPSSVAPGRRACFLRLRPYEGRVFRSAGRERCAVGCTGGCDVEWDAKGCEGRERARAGAGADRGLLLDTVSNEMKTEEQ